VHRFLRKLEEVCIGCLKEFQLCPVRREGLTGVWVKNVEGDWKKLVSVGIGVKKWITFHGLALNITTDLSYFRAISACGQNGDVMTSMEVELKDRNLPAPKFSEVKAK